MRIGIIPSDLRHSLCAAGGLYLYWRRQRRNLGRGAVLVIGGFTCAKSASACRCCATSGPLRSLRHSFPALAYKLLPPQIEKSVIEFTKYTNFLYLFITCIIVGSILDGPAGPREGLLQLLLPRDPWPRELSAR
jgi:hypothetical protein